MYVLKNIFACLFSVHNIINLSFHEQVFLMGLLPIMAKLSKQPH